MTNQVKRHNHCHDEPQRDREVSQFANVHHNGGTQSGGVAKDTERQNYDNWISCE